MVKVVKGSSEFGSAINVRDKLVVVDFFASWCGPCRRIAPFIETLSEKYPNVDFVKIQQDVPGGGNEDVFASESIKGFPTFRFYLNGNRVDEVVGASNEVLESKVVQHMKSTSTTSQFQGKGVSLGASQSVSVDEARERRLRQLEALTPVRQVESTNTRLTSMIDDDDDDQDAAAVQQALNFSTSSSSTVSQPVPQRQAARNDAVVASVDEALVATLTEMGFPEDLSRKAVRHSNNSLEAAIEYIDVLQNQTVQDNSTQPQSSSSSSNASQAMQVIEPELSLEDRKRAYEARLAQRRKQQEDEEKEAEIKREKERRKGGQASNQASEDMARLAKKAEADRKRLDDEDAKKRRERILSDISQHHPNLIVSASAAGASSAAAPVPLEEQVSRCIALLQGYRLNDQGKTCISMLVTILGNIANAPQEEKFRTLRLENARIKSQIASLAGGIQLLILAGFHKEEDKLIMTDV